MTRPTNNYAFIDSQNIHLGFQRLGWKLDWCRFRVYLREKYGVGTAYLFIGYLPENQELYRSLQRERVRAHLQADPSDQRREGEGQRRRRARAPSDDRIREL